MVSVHRYHEIAEAGHRILNPISADKVMLAARICGVGPSTRILDLASGKGELLCQCASALGATGVGVDIHPPLVAMATARAVELGVDAAVAFEVADAAGPLAFDHPFELVSCVGATWIGGGLAGTLGLMRRHLAPRGWLVVGEVFWLEPPPAAVAARYGAPDAFCDLAGTLSRFEAAGLDLVEMVVANSDDWDRYRASQWLAVSDWLAAHPDSDEADDVRAARDESRRGYLESERRCLGWGLFIAREVR